VLERSFEALAIDLVELDVVGLWVISRSSTAQTKVTGSSPPTHASCPVASKAHLSGHYSNPSASLKAVHIPERLNLAGARL